MDNEKKCPHCGGKLVEVKKGLLVCCICKKEKKKALGRGLSLSETI